MSTTISTTDGPYIAITGLVGRGRGGVYDVIVTTPAEPDRWLVLSTVRFPAPQMRAVVGEAGGALEAVFIRDIHGALTVCACRGCQRYTRPVGRFPSRRAVVHTG